MTGDANAASALRGADLRGGAALVTGAGRRVGRAIAEALGAHGMTVVVHHHGSAEGARETAAAIRESGGIAHVLRADLRDPDAPTRLVRDAATLCGGALDLVVNSAAVMECTPMGTVTADEWDAIMNLNLRAPFLICQAARDVMRDGGSLVNMADLAAFESWPGYVPHGISKAGIVQMTRSLARVFAPRLRMNAIAPGAVLLPDDWNDAAAEKLAASTPLRHIGSPADVVGAVLYLATAPYVTGHTILVDGGRHVRC